MITAYLAFNGNAEEAFNFYKDALGGKFANLQRFGDTPHGEQMPEQDKKKIMHVLLTAPNDVQLMGNDHLEFMGPFNMGNNISLSLHPETREQADELFNKLSTGGAVTMPLGDTFWGAYFGMFTDKFGIKWLVNHVNK